MILHGYAEHELKQIPDQSIDLIITSPPYANQRKSTYGGIPEDEYLEWFRIIAIEIKRVLKPTGSFFLNIKPHTNNGERSLYVFDLVIMLKREIGFRFIDEFAWIKNAFPGSHQGRFKNGFEPVYHFSVGDIKTIKFNPLECGTPIKEESKKRSFRKNVGSPKNGSGMSVLNHNFQKIKIARPSNVIYANNVLNQHSKNLMHSAVFPKKLVEFFIKSFTDKNDVVLDMFAGSGTVGEVCEVLDRKYILIEKELNNIELIKKVVSVQKRINF